MNLEKREIQRGVRVNLERILFSFLSLYLPPSPGHRAGRKRAGISCFPSNIAPWLRQPVARFVARDSTK